MSETGDKEEELPVEEDDGDEDEGGFGDKDPEDAVDVEADEPA